MRHLNFSFTKVTSSINQISQFLVGFRQALGTSCLFVKRIFFEGGGHI